MNGKVWTFSVLASSRAADQTGRSRRSWVSQVKLVVKNPLVNAGEVRVQSLGQEDPPEKETAIHCSTLAWRIPWSEEPGRLQSMGSQKLDMTEHTQTFLGN